MLRWASEKLLELRPQEIGEHYGRYRTWDKPWTGEYIWPATTKPIYEYACHEGNYALGDVLRGARHQEALEAAAKK